MFFVMFAVILSFSSVAYATPPSLPPCIPTTYDEDAVANYGSVCESQEDCIKSFCFQCPNDTQTMIYSSDFPSNQSYCGNTGIVQCLGELDGDEYYIEVNPPYWNSYSCCWYLHPGMGEQDCYDDLYAIKELEKHGLEIWKQVVLNNVSEDYFDEHFDIIEIDKTYIQLDYTEIDMEIYFTFNFDWVSYNSSERIEIKEKSGDGWVWLDDSEIISRFEHGRYIRQDLLTTYEIDSILSENETSSKMEECNVSMTRPTVSFDYPTGHLEARDYTYISCFHSDSDYSTYYRAEVDLITGDVSCSSTTSGCFDTTELIIAGQLFSSEQGFITGVIILLLVIVIVVTITLVKVKIF